MSIVITLALRRMRVPLLALIAAYAVSILGMTLVPGVDDQGRPWRMDFFHAFYFVSYMASTIGFGEIPYEFSAAQRMWATVSIYITVIAWLYAIGTLLTLLQDPAFREAVTRHRFLRAVRALRDPFYIICGYGDTGGLLLRALADRGIRAVVVDNDQDRLNELMHENLPMGVPTLCANANDSRSLLDAGLRSSSCAGVIAITDHDQVNLKIAITAKLLNPHIPVIGRAETREIEANMLSFGTDHVIDPFESFADRLAMALHSPAMHLVYEWLTGVPHTPLTEPVYPPHGRWVVCGYGRFGKAVCRYLEYEGIETTIVEATPDKVAAPEGTVRGPPTEAVTLRQARIAGAVGLVAGTDNDADNLSTIVTARELNPELFVVGRQNRHDNEELFRAAELDLVMQRSDIMAHRILAFLTNPALPEFLRQARHQGDEWANQFASRLSAVVGEEMPHVWGLVVDRHDAPAVLDALEQGEAVRVRELTVNPADREQRMPVLALLVRRGEHMNLVPDDGMILQAGDALMFCGREAAAEKHAWAAERARDIALRAHRRDARARASVAVAGRVARIKNECRSAIGRAMRAVRGRRAKARPTGSFASLCGQLIRPCFKVQSSKRAQIRRTPCLGVKVMAVTLNFEL